MDLSTLRQKFVEENGRADLVVDMTSFVDNGADYYIQSGQRLLDTLFDTQQSFAWYKRDIEIGDFFIKLQNVQAIKEVWMANDEGRIQLEFKPLGYIMENYNNVAIQAVGDMTFSGVPLDSETFVIDTTTFTFKTSASSDTEITIGSDAEETIDNAVTVINNKMSNVTAVKNGTTRLRIRAVTAGSAGNSIVFTESCSNVTINGGGTLGGTVVGVDGSSEDTGTPAYYTRSVAGLSPEQLSLTKSDFTDQFTYGLDGIILGSYYQYTNIIWMPPSDSAYTIEVLAKFFQKTLSSDSDENFWSVLYPEILLLAANYALEETYRNTEGMRDRMAAIMKRMDGIDKDIVEESISGVNQMEE